MAGVTGLFEGTGYLYRVCICVARIKSDLISGWGSGSSSWVRFVLTMLFGLIAGVTAGLDDMRANQPGDIDEAYFIERGITTQEGLPANGVTDLIQDSRGYIWASTYNGLVRFDGKSFKEYNVSTVEGLSGNRFISVYEDPEGRIWAGLENNSLLMVDRDSTEVFEIDEEEYGYNVQVAEFKHHHGEIDEMWVGTTSGLFLLSGGKFKYIDKFPDRQIAAIDWRDDRLYILYHDALYRYHPQQDKTVELIKLDEGNLITPNYTVSGSEVFDSISYQIMDLMLREDALWVLTNAGMVKLFENRYEPVFRHDEIDLRFPVSFNLVGETLYIAGDQGMLAMSRREDETYKFTQITGDYVSNQVLIDQEGSIWITTQTNGIRQFITTPININTAKFDDLRKSAVTAIIGDQDKNLWVATNCDGVFRYDDTSTLQYADNEMYNTCLWSALESRDGTLWFGSWGKGLYRLNSRLIGTDQDAFQLFQPELLIEEYDFDATLALHEDSQEQIWVGSYDGGLLRMQGDDIKRIPNEQGTWLSAVRGFYEDHNQRLWVATENGVGYVDNETVIKPDKLDLLSTSNYRTISQDPEGRYWFGSYGGGFVIYDGENQLVTLTAEHGLEEESISQLQFDKRGNLWMGGNKGIYYIDRTWYEQFLQEEINEIQVVGFGEEEGMPVRETTGGFHPSSHFDEEGTLYIPTVRGLVEIDTDRMKLNEQPPNVLIEEILVDGQTINGDRINQLEYDFQNLVIRYSALSLMNPGRNRYRYKLEGFHDEWQTSEIDREAVFSSLPPGEYTFKLEASNNHGYWNEEAVALSFYVSPPFWQTVPFYLAMILGIGGGAYGVFRYRIRVLKLREAELNRIVEEQTEVISREKELAEQNKAKIEQLYNIKSKFFANISHEFRTPITIIKGLTRQIISGKYGQVDDSVATRIMELEKTTDRLSFQINQLLDLARLETGKVEIKKEVYDLTAQVDSLYSMFSSLAEVNQLDFKYQPPDKIVWVNTDPEKMERILTNLISNALKYTDTNGKVAIRLQNGADSGDNLVYFEISDNGAGIPEAYQEKIFDRFQQGPETNEYGSGLGLALVKEWTELLGGNIQLSSRPSEGTTVMLELPIEADYHTRPPEGKSSLKIPEAESIDMVVSAIGPTMGEVTESVGDPEWKTVLVIEDHLDLRRYLKELLATDYNIIFEENGRKGLEKTKQQLPDIIITDIMMPEMGGIEFCRKLKKDPEISFIPVIMLTARADEQDELVGLEQGADAYIIKPFNDEKLLRTIKNLVATQNRLREKIKQEQNIEELVPASLEDGLLSGLDQKINEHIHDQDLKIEDLARELHITQRQLQRKIKNETGLTPKKYLIKRRLQAARYMLEHGTGTISEVGYAVGFNNLSLFSNYFKEEYGMRPSEFKGQIGK